MSEHFTPRRRQEHQGPWRKLTPDRINTAREVHERQPDGRTGGQVFDELYGEGNWAFDTTRFADERRNEKAMAEAANKLAFEGLRNVIKSNITSDFRGEPRKQVSDTYVDDDGNRLTGRVPSGAMPAAKGDILISPDGDAFGSRR